ncbi:MAG: hypothetical protein A2Y25_04970 [Candidatus Melainabacteria bacterium GWF2_37_15]|nr:MAG: hypothetical protein A2Y25_04970 [Candidatus Melainabacteria bacterium GWF2_37_15]
MDNNTNQRWYDTDPTVSLAVSFVRNLAIEEQTEIARRIIERGRALGIKVNEVRIVLHRRWYDENEELGTAMEYLRLAEPHDRKAIALDVIDFLTKIK